MEKLDKTIQKNNSVENCKNSSNRYGKIRYLLMSAIVAVAPGVIGCAGDYKKCAGKSGKEDLEMLKKWEDRCIEGAERFNSRSGQANEDILFDRAYRACKILNNKSFGVERNLSKAKDTAELNDKPGKAESCRKAIDDASERGQKGASLITELEGSQ